MTRPRKDNPSSSEEEAASGRRSWRQGLALGGAAAAAAALLVAMALPLFAGGQAFANGPADHTLPDDFVDEDVNPCTSAMTTITVSFTKAVVHETLDASGGVHFTFAWMGTFTTADGFSGPVTVSFASNAGSGGSGLEEFTITTSGPGGDGSGSLVNTHGVGHGTLKDGSPVVEFEKWSLEECLGKPS